MNQDQELSNAELGAAMRAIRRSEALPRRALLLGVSAVLFPHDALAQGDPCARYYGNGYCTDHVNRRTGVRTRGDAASWPANLQRHEVRAGDVIIFRRQNHVAYIEEVVEWGDRVPLRRGTYPVRLRISEMNYSPRRDPNAPRECLVTENFGRVTERIDTFERGAEFMRPRRR
jgi:hypothetical protein